MRCLADLNASQCLIVYTISDRLSERPELIHSPWVPSFFLVSVRIHTHLSQTTTIPRMHVPPLSLVETAARYNNLCRDIYRHR